MKKLNTHVTFDSYRIHIGKKEVVGISQSEWYQLLRQTVKVIEDETLEVLIGKLDNSIFHQFFSNRKFKGTEVIILQEYIRRVEFTEAEFQRKEAIRLEAEAVRESVAKENLRKFRESLRNDPFYTGKAAKDSVDPSITAQEEKIKAIQLAQEQKYKTRTTTAANAIYEHVDSMYYGQNYGGLRRTSKWLTSDDVVSIGNQNNYSLEQIEKALQVLGLNPKKGSTK